MANVVVGDRILIASRQNPGNSIIYRVTATPTTDVDRARVEIISELDENNEFTAGERLNVMFAFTGGRQNAAATPFASIHNFSIDIPSRVDLNTDLNVQHTLTFDVSNHTQLTSMVLIVNVGDNKTLTAPVIDGVQSQTVTLTGIDTSTASTVTFQLADAETGGTVFSNVVSIAVRNLTSGEQGYYGALADAAAFSTVDVSPSAALVTAVDVTASGTVFNVAITAQNGEAVGFLLPQNRNVVSIFNTVSNRFAYNPSDPSVSSTFTFAEAVRNDIDSLIYDLLTTVNNSGAAGVFNYRVTTE